MLDVLVGKKWKMECNLIESAWDAKIDNRMMDNFQKYHPVRDLLSMSHDADHQRVMSVTEVEFEYEKGLLFQSVTESFGFTVAADFQLNLVRTFQSLVKLHSFLGTIHQLPIDTFNNIISF